MDCLVLWNNISQWGLQLDFVFVWLVTPGPLSPALCYSSSYSAHFSQQCFEVNLAGFFYQMRKMDGIFWHVESFQDLLVSLIHQEFTCRAGAWPCWAGFSPWALEVWGSVFLFGVLPTFPSNGGWSISVQYSFPVIGLSACNNRYCLSCSWAVKLWSLLIWACCFAPGSWLDKFLSLSFRFLDISSVLLSLWYFSWKVLLWRLSVVVS